MVSQYSINRYIGNILPLPRKGLKYPVMCDVKSGTYIEFDCILS